MGHLILPGSYERRLGSVERRVADVTAHGAVGDGVTDDTGAIQAAIDFIAAAGGGTVYLPPSAGGYGVTPSANGGLVVPSGVTLQGSGYPGRIKRRGAYAAGVVQYLIKSENMGSTVVADHHIELRDLWIDGGGPIAGALGDLQTVCVKIGAGATGPTGKGYRIEGCTFSNWPGPVIHLLNAEQFRIAGNLLDSPQRGGIVIWHASHDGAITGNVVRNASDDCIAINSDAGVTANAAQPQRIAITGNTLSEVVVAGQTTDTCIALRGVADCTVAGNVCDGSSALTAAIKLEETSTTATFHNQRIAITGNTVRNAAGHGIGLNGEVVKDVRIADNIVSGTDKAAIWLWQSSATTSWDDIAVEGNTLVDNGGASISAAIFAQITAGATLRLLSICRNVILRPYGSAISFTAAMAATDVKVNGNFVRDPNQGSLASTPAISLQGITNFQVLDTMVAVGVAPATKANYAVRLVSGDRGLFSRLSARAINFGTAAYQILATNVLDLADHQTG